METVARATGPGTRTSAALVPAHGRPTIKEEENQLRESIESLPPTPQEPASANLNLTGDLEVVLNRLRRHYGLKAGKVSDGMVRALRERDDENGFREALAAGLQELGVTGLGKQSISQALLAWLKAYRYGSDGTTERKQGPGGLQAAPREREKADPRLKFQGKGTSAWVRAQEEEKDRMARAIWQRHHPGQNYDAAGDDEE